MIYRGGASTPVADCPICGKPVTSVSERTESRLLCAPPEERLRNVPGLRTTWYEPCGCEVGL